MLNIAKEGCTPPFSSYSSFIAFAVALYILSFVRGGSRNSLIHALLRSGYSAVGLRILQDSMYPMCSSSCPGLVRNNSA